MTDLKQLSAITALNNMMDSGRFDICCLRDVGELLGVNPKAHASYAILSPLHCIHFSKMPQELAAAIPQLVEDCLGLSPTYKFTSVEPGRVIEVSPSKETGPLRLAFWRKP